MAEQEPLQTQASRQAKLPRSSIASSNASPIRSGQCPVHNRRNGGEGYHEKRNADVSGSSAQKRLNSYKRQYQRNGNDDAANHASEDVGNQRILTKIL